MAKTPKTSAQDGEISVTIVKFTMSGSDASVQKGLEAMKAALGQAGLSTAQPEVRQFRSNGARQLSGSMAPEAVDTEDAADAEVLDAEVEDLPTVARTPSAPRPKPKVKNYVAVADPGFNSTSPTLKEFATSKNPPNDTKKFLVIAYWCKHTLNQPNVSAELFYTAFREMKWTVPTDIAQNVRELRSTRDQRLMKGSEANTSCISLLGENAVDELGKADA